MPRFGDNYELMHIDVLAAWVFVWGAAVLMFGLRPVNRYWLRYWLIWLTPMVLSPLFYRTLAVELGGTRFAYSVIMVVVSSLATTVAVSLNWRRGLIAFLISNTCRPGFGVLPFTPIPNRPAFRRSTHSCRRHRFDDRSSFLLV
ncbi:hypothetical protein [Rhodococcus sp. MS16]|nr:hypothetical protein [Rhodococcus sp. MS16]